MKFFRRARIIPVIVVAMLTAFVVSAQAPYPLHLILTGGGFSQPQDQFYIALATRAIKFDLPSIQILVMPVGIGSNPNTITDAERTAQLASAEQLRQEIEANCRAFVPVNMTCSANLIPVITRNDAMAVPTLEEFSSKAGGIYFLQSNARTILEIIRGTALEQEIIAAYQAGAVISGPGNLFSKHFIYGFRPKFGPTRALTFGAVLKGETAEDGGLNIFPEQALVDTHPFSENRFGRLLNAITGPEDPHLGIGVEAGTGFEFTEDNHLGGIFGESVVAILDSETYKAANGLTYQPGMNLIGIRNVLLQLIAPGPETYDLGQRQSSLSSVKKSISREFDELYLPPGSGTIVLTSNLITNPSAFEKLIEFTNLSGGQNAHLLIVAIGYMDVRSAEVEAAQITSKLGVASDVLFVQPESDEPIRIESDITGIILTGPDTSLVRPGTLQPIQSSWQAGLPILADRAGAAILGKQYPSRFLPDGELPIFSSSRYIFRAGLGLINANIEPHALENYSWERILITAHQFSMMPVVGIAPGAAIIFTPDSMDVMGTNVVCLVDLRAATLATNESGLIEIANGLVDIYTPGEHIQTLIADSEAAPIHAPTPVLEATTEVAIQASNPPITATPSAGEIQPEPNEAPREKQPTRTPRPTSTPVPTPPPSDPGTTNLMVFFGVLSVVVVIVGVWLNRQAGVE